MCSICIGNREQLHDSYIPFNEHGLTAELYPVDCSQPGYQQVKNYNQNNENAKQVQEQQLKQQILSRQKQQQQQEQQQKLLLGHPEKLSEIYAENQTESKATENQTTKNNQHRSGQNNGYHFQGSSAKNNNNYGYKVTSPVRVCSPVTSIDSGRVCAGGNSSVDSIKSDCIKSCNQTGQRKRWRAKGKKQR